MSDASENGASQEVNDESARSDSDRGSEVRHHDHQRDDSRPFERVPDTEPLSLAESLAVARIDPQREADEFRKAFADAIAKAERDALDRAYARGFVDARLAFGYSERERDRIIDAVALAIADVDTDNRAYRARVALALADSWNPCTNPNCLVCSKR
jgi:hypothetical protein